MQILDSNLIFYSALPEYANLRPIIKRSDTYVSAISRLEVLGFHKLDSKSKTYFEGVFDLVSVLPITDIILESAINLRQNRKMSVGDAIIAATGQLYDLDLQTRNTADFDWIPNLKINNPLV